MTTKLTAEQVKFRLRELAELDELGLRTANAAYEHAGDIVRDNLIESPDERRERFERWYRHDCETRRGIFNRSMARDMRGVGEYRDENIETAWQAFNAALDFGGGGDA